MAESNFIHLCWTILISTIFIGNAVAQISVVPQWETTDSDAQQCSIKEENINNKITFELKGSTIHPCSVQVIVIPGFQISIEIPQGNPTRDHGFVYTYFQDEEDDILECDSKYLVFNVQLDKCKFSFSHRNISLNIQGNVILSVNGISAVESQPLCFLHDVDAENLQFYSNSQQTSECQEIMTYNDQITCDIDNDGRCNMLFASQCDASHASLGYRQVALHCKDKSKMTESTVMILYPIETLILDLSWNMITNLHKSQTYPGLFPGMEGLTKLFIDNNKLKLLDGYVFHGLKRVYDLDLSHNNIYNLLDGVFSELQSLRYIGLKANNLAIVTPRLFQGLHIRTLLDLYLGGNKLATLPQDFFSHLEKQKMYVLDLQENLLTTLPFDVFKGLVKMIILRLQRNKLTILSDELFPDLKSLFDLSLNGNLLETLPNGQFTGIAFMQCLELGNNQLTLLTTGTFAPFGRLQELYLYINKLTTLPHDIFDGLRYLQRLSLSHNNLAQLNVNVFQKLVSLNMLHMADNELQSLPKEIFRELRMLRTLILYSNNLTILHKDIFQGLTHLVHLDIDDDMLTRLPNIIFHPIRGLKELHLSSNQLITPIESIFQYLKNLISINLSFNKIINIPKYLFNGLSKLEFLSLGCNQISELGPVCFQGLVNLKYIYLYENRLRKLHSYIFIENINLIEIKLQINELNKIPDIKHLSKLQFLDLISNPLINTASSLRYLPNGVRVMVSQPEICECYVSHDINCSAADLRSPYLTCDSLLSNKALLIVMWAIGINALIGNVFVIVWRKKHPQGNYVQNVLLGNLAISDSLMGIYMIMITVADIYYGEHFPLQSETWRTGVMCRIAGTLVITSSEASVFFITTISIDRFINLRDPYSLNKMGKTSTRVTIIVIWVFALILGLVPSILAGRNFIFYDNSHVCIGLPLSLSKQYTQENVRESVQIDYYNYVWRQELITTFTGFETGLYFSVALFLGLNAICLLVIFLCYIGILRAIRTSASEAGRKRGMKEEIKTTLKVIAIVSTDFMIWFPIIVMGILVQSRVVILPPAVYAWVVTFVLPINSAINPYLYTIAEIISNVLKRKQHKSQNN